LVSFLSSLFAWANVPYSVALGTALAFAILQMTGILGLLAGGNDHDADHDHDVDVDADGDVDGDADADADGDHDADHDADHGHGVGHHLLVDLGVGRVPMSVIWQTFAVSFAFAGIAINTIYAGRVGAPPTYSLAWTIPISLLFGYLVTRAAARALGKVMANPEQEATSRKELVGQAGVVISSKVSAEFGEVRVRDKSGHVIRIICRTREGERPIREGREVVIVDHDRDRDWLFVAPLDDVGDGDDDKSADADADADKAPEGDQAAALAAEEEARAAEEERARRLQAS
jgi:membrane protein implicated in regulation of membrane protease activity